MFGKALAIAKFPRTLLVSSALPMKLTVGLTYRCQSRCNHCELWKTYDGVTQNSRREAKSDTYLKMLQDLKDDVVWVEFTGGEPFLRKEIVEIAAFSLNNTGTLAVGITSNGLDHDLVVKQVHEILLKSKRKQLVVGISIDGDPESYEQVRGVNGFYAAMDTYLELKRLASHFRNLRPHIAYTISRFNVGSFPHFYDFVSDEYGIAISEISFTVEHPFGYYFHKDSTSGMRVSDSFKAQTLKDVQSILDLRHREKLNHTRPLNLFYEYYLKNLFKYFANPQQQVIPCKACDLSAYIDPYGYVHPCTIWKKELGNLKNASFKTIWSSTTKQAVMQNVRTGKCPNCWTPCEAEASWLFNFGMIRGWW